MSENIVARNNGEFYWLAINGASVATSGLPMPMTGFGRPPIQFGLTIKGASNTLRAITIACTVTTPTPRRR